MVSDGAAQHGVAGLERVEDGVLRDRTFNVKFDFTPNVGQGAKMLWKLDSNHYDTNTP